MGDLRNTINKIERAKAEKANGDAWLRRRGINPNPPPSPPSHMLSMVCRGCWHNHMEVRIYSCKLGYWDRVEYWCWKCMPEKFKGGYDVEPRWK